MADKKVVTKSSVTKKSVGTKKNQQQKSNIDKGAKKVAKAKNSVKKIVKNTLVKVVFQLRYKTAYGQNLFVTGNTELLGNNNFKNALPLQYFNDEFWFAEIEMPISNAIITYNYVLQNADGTILFDSGNDKFFTTQKLETLLLIDSWNYTGYIENVFFTEPFKNVLLKSANNYKQSLKNTKQVTHTFKIKAPLLPNNKTICLLGNATSLSNWDTNNAVILSKDEQHNFYTVSIDLSKHSFPLVYKYGIYDCDAKVFEFFEDGNNRIIYDATKKNKCTIVNDGFITRQLSSWKGTGVAIPVFSLKSNNSFGVGEFTDLHLLADWCEQVGIKLIQILPINDTTATFTNKDSYPYAAISAFALHPIYLNLQQIVNAKNKQLLSKLEKLRAKLNSLDTVDYETVIKTKIDFAKQIFELQGNEILNSDDYKNYYLQNKHWLVPYAAFCYLRDEYGTADFGQWPAYKIYNQLSIDELIQPTSTAYNTIAFYYFVQYQLHVQLKNATAYAHKKGIIVKGDIAIGVYRYGADTWQQPQLYNMDLQAGAPPDDFAIKGQNWGFPTYNWQKMKQDEFAWWRQRFEQMSYYFDAFRIDHILGFFRIWSIPTNAVEGIMGYFVPALPIHISEFSKNNILFDYNRYTKPFINNDIVENEFGTNAQLIKNDFLVISEEGNFLLKEAYNTQKKVEQYFAALPNSKTNNLLKQGLYNLISNVILFEVEGSQGQQFHFRFGMANTPSYKALKEDVQSKLYTLYVDYFFKRQDDYWKKEALEKLPALKRATNMLICGEDLGLVPDCVPDLMKQLGLLSLEIQRMPKDMGVQFFHPNTAPYLSVVTPSTHDMSTIRGWWEEDKTAIQHFYNSQLGQYGAAPFYCEAAINKSIIIQHLYSPAIWAIFQLQDLLGIDADIRRANPNDERINVPANPNHFWCYRMHFSIEELIQKLNFSKTLQHLIHQSGR